MGQVMDVEAVTVRNGLSPGDLGDVFERVVEGLLVIDLAVDEKLEVYDLHLDLVLGSSCEVGLDELLVDRLIDPPRHVVDLHERVDRLFIQRLPTQEVLFEGLDQARIIVVGGDVHSEEPHDMFLLLRGPGSRFVQEGGRVACEIVVVVLALALRRCLTEDRFDGLEERHAETQVQLTVEVVQLGLLLHQLLDALLAAVPDLVRLHPSNRLDQGELLSPVCAFEEGFDEQLQEGLQVVPAHYPVRPLLADLDVPHPLDQFQVRLEVLDTVLSACQQHVVPDQLTLLDFSRSNAVLLEFGNESVDVEDCGVRGAMEMFGFEEVPDTLCVKLRGEDIVAMLGCGVAVSYDSGDAWAEPPEVKQRSHS